MMLSEAEEHFAATSKQISVLCAFGFRLHRVSTVLRHGLPDALFTLDGLRSRAQPTVKPAASVCHRWALARAAAAGLRSAPGR